MSLTCGFSPEHDELREGMGSASFRSRDLDLRIERHQRLRESPGKWRCTDRCGPDTAVHPVDAVHGGAAGTGIALVALMVRRIAEIAAAVSAAGTFHERGAREAS